MFSFQGNVKSTQARDRPYGMGARIAVTSETKALWVVVPQVLGEVLRFAIKLIDPYCR
jgi:hypothetical protein